MVRYLLCSFFLCLVAVSTHAQQRYYYHIKYENMSERQQMAAQRSYVGLSYPSMTISSDNRYIVPAGYNTSAIDTAFSLKKRSGFGIGFILGQYFKIVEYRNMDVLALDVAFTAEYCGWKIDGAGVVNTNTSYKTSITNYSLPLSLMYKHGAEAELNKERKYMFSAGLGIQPSRIAVYYIVLSADSWKFRPFVVAECGVFAGLALKLRATYYPLSTSYYSTLGNANDKNELKANVTGSSNLVISFLIMMRSNHWGE